VAIDLSGVSQAALEGSASQDDATLAQALQSSFDDEYAGAGGGAASAADEARQAERDVCWKLRRDAAEFVARAAKQLEVEELEHNPASQPGQPLYEKFKKAHDAAQDKTMKLVFHGSPDANMEAIAREGLDPTRRSGQAYGAGEYFGTDVSTSLGYCRGGKRMLVFAVLCDKAGITNEVDLATGRQHTHLARPAGAAAATGGGGGGRRSSSAPYLSSAFASAARRASHPAPSPAAAPAAAPADAPGPGILVIHRDDYQLPLGVIRINLGEWSEKEMDRRKRVVREAVMRKRQRAGRGGQGTAKRRAGGGTEVDLT